jgi:hypothetical protein
MHIANEKLNDHDVLSLKNLMEGFPIITTSILKHWTLMEGLEARK